MKKLVLIFTSIILINFTQAQSNCEYLIFKLTDELSNDRPQNYNSALKLSQTFSANWMIAGCDRNSNEFMIIKNELRTFVEYIYSGKSADEFYFTFLNDSFYINNQTIDKVNDNLEEIEFEEEEEEEAVLFAVVEDPPIFYNCNKSASREEKMKCFQQGVMKHVADNFEYPAISKEMGISEKILVNFHVGKDGKIINAQVIRGEDKYLKAEALRLVKSIPKLIPANQRGQAVNCTFTIPISFTLQ